MKGSTKFWISCAVFYICFLVYNTALEWPTFDAAQRENIIHIIATCTLTYTGVSTFLVFVFYGDDDYLYEYKLVLPFWPPYWVYFVVTRLNKLLDKIFD